MRRYIAYDASGASAVEFAAVCPIMVLFLLGAIYFGIYLSIVHSVQQLSADAARASIAGLDDAERTELASDFVSHGAERYFLVDPVRLKVAAGPAAGIPEAFEVSVTYDAGPVLAWFPNGLLPAPGTTIRRAAVIRNGGL